MEMTKNIALEVSWVWGAVSLARLLRSLSNPTFSITLHLTDTRDKMALYCHLQIAIL